MHQQIILKDDAEEFTVSVFQGPDASRTLLFAVGGGGTPGRHTPLLRSLAEQGCTVVAPHFERMTGRLVSGPELALRIRRVNLALAYASTAEQAIYGVGHSIGAAILIGLAGGQIWLHDGNRLDIGAGKRIKKMVVFTPAMDFFTAPCALDAVRTPIQAWAGSLDAITPPSQTAFLKNSLGSLVDARVIEGAGHFSFMNELPPNLVDTIEDREPFLAHLNLEVGKFLFS
jgi:alpha-beta hydrolase superfamily lysophospholipase